MDLTYSIRTLFKFTLHALLFIQHRIFRLPRYLHFYITLTNSLEKILLYGTTIFKHFNINMLKIQLFYFSSEFLLFIWVFKFICKQ